jgi:hypothetical protein
MSVPNNAREHIRSLFEIPALQEAAGTHRMDIDPAELVLTTFQHNHDARIGARRSAYELVLDKNLCVTHLDETMIDAFVSHETTKNLYALQDIVVGQRFSVEAKQDHHAIEKFGGEYISRAIGSVVVRSPRSFLSRSGAEAFNLYNGRIRPVAYRVIPLDAQGEPIVSLQTL